MDTHHVIPSVRSLGAFALGPLRTARTRIAAQPAGRAAGGTQGG